jgi:hypothetical protein
MDLRTQVIEFRTVTETTRKELEIARTAIASLTAKTEQIPPLSAELVQLRQESKDRASDLAKSQAELAKMGKDRDHFKDQMGKEKGSGVIFNPT